MSLPLVFLPLDGHLSHVCHCPTKSPTHCIYFISSILTPLVSNTPFMLSLYILPSSISPPYVCHNPRMSIKVYPLTLVYPPPYFTSPQ